jgi:amidase
MSVNGCLSRTVADTALFLDLTSGGSPEAGAPRPPERPFAEAARTPPGRLRIATSTKPPRLMIPAQVRHEVVAAIDDAAEALASLGHDVFRRDPDWGNIGNNITVRYLRGIHDDVALVPHPERLERRTRGFGRLGAPFSDGLLARARAAEANDWRRVGAVFEHCDVLMTPVMGRTAIPVRRWEGRGAARIIAEMPRPHPFTSPWNHLGNPAASVPFGFSADGLPLAVMLVGRPGDEATLLSLSAQIEAERPWLDRRPPVG